MATSDKITIKTLTDSALSTAKQYISKEPETIISVEKNDKEWIVVVEALERKAVPNTQDILGRYEIKFNNHGELIGWKQRMVRKRSDRLMLLDEDLVDTA